MPGIHSNPHLSSVTDKLIKSCEKEVEGKQLNSENETVKEEEGGGCTMEIVCVCVDVSVTKKEKYI